jgi:type II secretory pathway pseudopilin PulG
MGKRRKGLTLIEVMLVIAFLSMALFPILQMFSRGYLISSESGAALAAISLAEKYMEGQKNLDYSSIVNEAKSPISGYPGFSREIIVSEPDDDLKDVEVKVYYTIGDSELEIGLKTLVANY